MDNERIMDVCTWCGRPILWVRPGVTWKKCDPHERTFSGQVHRGYLHVCRVADYRERMEEIGTHPAVVKDWVDALIARANREHGKQRREEAEEAVASVG